MPYSSNQKRKKILSEGKALFWKYGFKRVTVEEICSAAKVSKMTYYKFFANKMELVMTIMEDTFKESIDQYEKIMNSDIPFTEKIELQIQMKMEGTTDISKEFVDDLMIHGDPKLMEFMSQKTQETLGIVHSHYINAQEKGEIRKDIKPEFIIYFLNHIYEMLKDDKLINMYKDPNELAMELIRFFFYGIHDLSGKTN